MCVCIYIYICMYIYIYTYICIYVYTCPRRAAESYNTHGTNTTLEDPSACKVQSSMDLAGTWALNLHVL